MPVDLVQYRGTVGVFNNRKFHNKMVANKFYSSQCGFNAGLAVLAPFSIHQIILFLLTILICMSKDNYVQSIKRLCISFIIIISIHSILRLWFYSILITLSADPKPKRNSTETFSFCLWNLSSIYSHNYVKISLLKAYITVHKFDIISLSETYEEASVPTKKISTVLNIIFLNECVNFELRIGDKTFIFFVLYRSPSQSQDVFESFCKNFERTLDNLAQNHPFLLVAIGDFNVKSTNWCASDQTSFEGNKIEHITSQFGLSQIINESTHILDSSSTCIDLIFTSQPNLVVESGLHPSLHQNCHHQLFMLSLTYKFFTLHHTAEKFGTIKMQILT